MFTLVFQINLFLLDWCQLIREVKRIILQAYFSRFLYLHRKVTCMHASSFEKIALQGSKLQFDYLARARLSLAHETVQLSAIKLIFSQRSKFFSCF